MDQDDEQRQLDHARRALVAEFAGRVPPEQVEERFSTIVRQFDAAPIRGFVPVLVARQARAGLKSVNG